MFNWREFISFLILMTVILFITCLVGTGLYLMSETGNAWGYALVVGGIILGGSFAIGLGL